MSNQKLTQNVFQQGLDVDTSDFFKSNSSYDYALNSVIESVDGNKGSIVNEQGNFNCVNIKPDYKIIGSVYISQNSIVLFSTNNIGSEIGIFNPEKCSYTELINSSCLNFNTKYPIKALFKIKNGCDKIIYFTDNYNNYRVINLDDLPYYFDSNTQQWICSRFDMSPDLTVPTIEKTSVLQSGGSLKYGSYVFGFRYVDKYLNPTNWLLTTDPVYVYSESLGGPKNIIDSSNEVGVYPATKKSIKLELNNVDSNFTYYQWAVVEYTSGTGTVSNVRISDNISTTEKTWTYTGTNFVSSTTATDLLVDKRTIEKVKAHNHVDNRLFLANTENYNLDYFKLQQAAMKITSVCKIIDDTNSLFNKSKKFLKTYMKDEVYAFAITGRLKNGKMLPAFHIPGRKAIDNTHPNWASFQTKFNMNYDNTEWLTLRAPYGTETKWDKQANPQNNSLLHDTSKDCTFTQKALVDCERWELYNTAFISDNAPVDEKDWTVQMAYWESSEVYPSVKDCSNNLLFGTDTGQKIRHHKFPDTNLLPRQSVGIEFDIQAFLDELPNSIKDEIVEWKILQAVRTEENKTVIDKGITTIRETNDFYYGTSFPHNLLSNEFTYTGPTLTYPTAPTKFDLVRFYSPKTLFDNKLLNGTHLKIEAINWMRERKEMTAPFSDANIIGVTDSANGNLDIYYYKMISKAQTSSHEPSSGTFSYPTNIKIEDSIFINTPDTTITPAYVQGSMNNVNPAAVQNRNYTPRTFQLRSSEMYRIVNPTQSSNPSSVSEWHPFVTYCSIKDDKKVYLNLSSLTYCLPEKQEKTLNKILVKGGDSFISLFNFEIASRGIDKVHHTTISDRVSKDIYFIVVESDINVSLRHSTVVNPFTDIKDNAADDKCGSFYSGEFLTSVLQNEALNSILNHYDGGDGDSNYGNFTCKEYFGYNEDFSVSHSFKTYFPIPYSFDYCNTCIDKNPYRIYYSEKDFQETSTDNYKNIKENNYIDVEGFSGEINALFKDKDQLYVLTDKSLYMLPVRPQTLQSNESNIYIGTGEVLSIPPRKISTVDYEYSGTNQIESVVTTEYGTLYVDDVNLKVFNLRDGLEEISQNGMSSFFKKYLPLKLKTKLTELYTHAELKQFSFNNTIDGYSCGFKAVYDPYYKRYILTKKDFSLTQDALDLLNTLSVSDNLRLNPTTGRFERTINSVTTVINDLNDYPALFKNESWTISYGLESKKWISFHSYIPYYSFNTGNTFYTMVDKTHYGKYALNLPVYNYVSRIWKHDFFKRPVYQTYYENKFDHVIEYTINENANIAKTLDSIILHSNTYLVYNDSLVETRHKTFNKVLVYTNNQSTSISNVTVIGNTFNTLLNQMYWKDIEKTYYLSNIRDYTVANNSPINIGDYLNFVEYSDNINTNMSLFESERLRDKVFKLRLIFNENNNYKIVTDLVSTKIQISPR